MFKVPEWGNDVPQTNAEFNKKTVKISKKSLKDGPLNNNHNKPKKNTSVNKAKINEENAKHKNIRKTNFKSKNNLVNNKKIKNSLKNATKTNFVSLPKPNLKVSNETNNIDKKNKNIINSLKNSTKTNFVSLQNHNFNVSNETTKTNKSGKKNKSRNKKINRKINLTKHSLDTSPDDETNLNSKKEKNNKRNLNNEIKIEHDNVEISNLDGDKLDEVLLNVKRKKINEQVQNDDQEDILFKENQKGNKKTVTKKEIVKNNIKANNREKHQNGENNINISKENLLNKKQKKKNVSKKEIIVKNNVNENKGEIENNKTKDVIVNNNLTEEKKVKIDPKKEIIRQMLQHKSLTTIGNIKTGQKGDKLRERMLERLKSAQFRYLNEKLYTSSGTEAHQLFQSDPDAFKTYHEGYQQQLKKWPVNPLDLIVKRIQKMPKSHKIADLGCGEAALSQQIPNPVRSFDLVATAPGVEVCDMAHTPLLAASMDVAVYCLALMGNQLTQYLVEANRILKVGGHLLIAEVESRFGKVEDFTKEVERLGFKLKKLDKSHTVFFFMEFTKIRDASTKKSKLPNLTLKPCIYKKR